MLFTNINDQCPILKHELDFETPKNDNVFRFEKHIYLQHTWYAAIQSIQIIQSMLYSYLQTTYVIYNIRMCIINNKIILKEHIEKQFSHSITKISSTI